MQSQMIVSSAFGDTIAVTLQPESGVVCDTLPKNWAIEMRPSLWIAGDPIQIRPSNSRTYTALADAFHICKEMTYSLNRTDAREPPDRLPYLAFVDQLGPFARTAQDRAGRTGIAISVGTIARAWILLALLIDIDNQVGFPSADEAELLRADFRNVQLWRGDVDWVALDARLSPLFDSQIPLLQAAMHLVVEFFVAHELSHFYRSHLNGGIEMTDGPSDAISLMEWDADCCAALVTFEHALAIVTSQFKPNEADKAAEVACRLWVTCAVAATASFSSSNAFDSSILASVSNYASPAMRIVYATVQIQGHCERLFANDSKTCQQTGDCIARTLVACCQYCQTHFGFGTGWRNANSSADAIRDRVQNFWDRFESLRDKLQERDRWRSREVASRLDFGP